MRALVVEDDPVSTRLLEYALVAEGIVVECSDTGEDAHLLTLFDLADAACWRPLAHRLAQLRATLATDGSSPAQQ